MGPKVDVCPPGDQNEAFWPINNELEAIRALIFPSEVDRCSFQGGLKTLKELDRKGLRSTGVRHSEFRRPRFSLVGPHMDCEGTFTIYLR